MAKVNNNDVWIYILRLREGRCKFRDSHSNLSELAEGLGFLWLHPLCLAVIPRLVFTNDVLVTASWRRRPCCSNECTRCRMSTSPCIVRTVTSSRREAVGRRREVLRSWQAVNVSDASECFVSHMINCRFVGSGRGVRGGSMPADYDSLCQQNSVPLWSLSSAVQSRRRVWAVAVFFGWRGLGQKGWKYQACLFCEPLMWRSPCCDKISLL